MLEVGHITTGGDVGIFADRMQPLNILEASKGAV